MKNQVLNFLIVLASLMSVQNAFADVPAVLKSATKESQLYLLTAGALASNADAQKQYDQIMAADKTNGPAVYAVVNTLIGSYQGKGSNGQACTAQIVKQGDYIVVSTSLEQVVGSFESPPTGAPGYVRGLDLDLLSNEKYLIGNFDASAQIRLDKDANVVSIGTYHSTAFGVGSKCGNLQKK